MVLHLKTIAKTMMEGFPGMRIAVNGSCSDMEETLLENAFRKDHQLDWTQHGRILLVTQGTAVLLGVLGVPPTSTDTVLTSGDNHVCGEIERITSYMKMTTMTRKKHDKK